MFRYFVFGFLTLAFSLGCIAQTEIIHDSESHISGGHNNRFGFFSGTSLVPTHVSKGKDEILYVPTYGIEYERIFSRWFAVGINNEIELQNYVIENAAGESINRSFIYVVSVVAIFQPIKNIILFIGPGYELTSDHNFAIVKVGAYYPFKLTRQWDFTPLIAFDRVSNLYTTFTFGISVGKKF